MSLTRDELLARSAPAVREVECPALGGTVFVRAMTLGDLATFNRGEGDVSARLLVRTLCDGEGRRLFTDQEEALLTDLPGKPLQDVAYAAGELNGLTGKPAEDAEKRSAPTPT